MIPWILALFGITAVALKKVKKSLVNTPKVRLITNISEAEKMVGEYGATRFQSGSGQTKFADGRKHYARDIYLPEGSPVFTPVTGVWDRWVPSNEDGSLDMGWIGVLRGIDGNTYRFIHIAVKNKNDSLVKDITVPEGTFIGCTSLRNLGSSKSHLHLDITNKKLGTRLDPLKVLGVRGFNLLTHGA